MAEASQAHEMSINWFREASPYIKAHRGSTMVLCLPDVLLDSDLFDTLIPDLTLLSHLGVRVVIGFGLRSQVDSRLEKKQTPTQVIDGRRVTDDDALASLITAAGRARALFESRLSMGLPNTPMAGARLSVCSGNFITARPFGVHNGVDYMHTGTVRQVHSEEMRSHLTAGNIVLLPPVGYSLTGDIFNVPAEEVATDVAIALKADKLIFFVPNLPEHASGQCIREASANTMERLAPQQSSDELVRTLGKAVLASRKGVGRVHLLKLDEPNALLRELFTRDGGGTLVTAERWENLRGATNQDINGILELIKPMQEDGALATRTREQMVLDIDNFVVCERDGMVIACAALFVDSKDANTDEKVGEIACVVTHPDYRGQGRAGDLIAHLENAARSRQISKLVLLSTRAAHWFIERGYTEQPTDSMPATRNIQYDSQRNSKLFTKLL